MQISQIEAFLAVAAELNYRKAASRLGYSPSHVSQQVAQLERQLGFPLFARSTHHVALTAQGARLLPEAEALLKAHGRVLDAARRIASEHRPVLRLSYSSGSAGPATAAIRAFVAERGEVDVTLAEVTTRQLTSDLLEGHADVGLALSSGAEVPDGLAREVLFEYAQDHLAVPTDHPLATAEAPTVADLAGERLVVPSSDVNADHGPRIVAFLEQAGVVCEPRPHAVRTEEEVVDLVAAGMGVAFVGRSTWERLGGWPGVAIRPLSGPVPQLSQLLLWRADDTSSLVTAFVALVSGGGWQGAPGPVLGSGARASAEAQTHERNRSVG